MASYEVLAHQSINQSALIDETSFIATKTKKSFLPSHGIKKLLKSVRKFFKKPKTSTIQYNGDLSIMEILPNEQHTVDVSFFSEEECDNLENERLEAQMESLSQ